MGQIQEAADGQSAQGGHPVRRGIAYLALSDFAMVDDATTEGFLAFLVATGPCAGAFGLQGAFVAWRGRSMFDPPGLRRAPKRVEA
jgi:hypothetical protein